MTLNHALGYEEIMIVDDLVVSEKIDMQCPTTIEKSKDVSSEQRLHFLCVLIN
jgi:hypothetical protein